jgi:hypothetical protein
MAIKFFAFETDFVEDRLRCIPMIVRFKLDAIGIKLKLSQWSKFSVDERTRLALQGIDSEEERAAYISFLTNILISIGDRPTPLNEEQLAYWPVPESPPILVTEKAKAVGGELTPSQWKRLDSLKKFALIKLAKSSHESANFPHAMREFALM